MRFDDERGQCFLRCLRRRGLLHDSRIGIVNSASMGSSLRLRLLQPEPHVYLAVPRRRGGQVLLGLLALPGSSIPPADTEVAVGDEEAPAELNSWFGRR
jgi:hypothetical protein